MGRTCHDLSRRVLLSEPGGKCPRRRSRLRWEDGVEEDVARLGCRNWKIVALNREGWRKLLKEVEAHPGLYSRWREREMQQMSICCIWLAFYFHILTTIHGQNHNKFKSQLSTFERSLEKNRKIC